MRCTKRIYFYFLPLYTVRASYTQYSVVTFSEAGDNFVGEYCHMQRSNELSSLKNIMHLSNWLV